MKLKGLLACEGKFEGKLKIYEKGKKYDSKDILVAEATSPEMVSEVLNCGAVLTEQGGLLSHAAIFCREIKKPCIVGIKGLLESVSDGMIAIIDGKKGIVETISNDQKK